MSKNSLNPHYDFKKHLLLLSPYIDEETEAEFQILLCSGASMSGGEVPAPNPEPRRLAGRVTRERGDCTVGAWPRAEHSWEKAPVLTWLQGSL